MDIERLGILLIVFGVVTGIIGSQYLEDVSEVK